MATRFDFAQMKPAVRTPQGFLRAPALATRTGVFYYRLPDGTMRRELRHPDDVFHADSMATLCGVPLTDDHPNAKDPKVMLLDADTASDHMIGYTGDNVQRADNFLATNLTITNGAAIAAVERGKVELSCGYTCDELLEPGTYEGEPYDLRQVNIVYNHLAIVDRGRAGPNARIKFDAADAVQCDKTKEDTKMEKIVINGVTYDVSPEAKKAIEGHMIAKIDSDNAVAAARKAEATRADTAEAKADTLKAENDKLAAKVAAKTDAAPEVVAAAVKERRSIEKVAEKVLTKEECEKMDAMDNVALMSAVIKADHKDVNLEGKSRDYIVARFDGVAAGLSRHEDRKTTVPGTTKSDGSSDTDDAEKARKDMMEYERSRWSKPTAAAQ